MRGTSNHQISFENDLQNGEKHGDQTSNIQPSPSSFDPLRKMSPTPIKFNSIQPFKAVRDNWSSLKPYHDNYLTTISLATVLTAFIGTVGMIIKHGFKMPRLHPMMEVEELEPSIPQHPNEYVSEKDLAEAKLFEFEQEQRWEMAMEEHQRQETRAKEAEKQMENVKEVGRIVAKGSADLNIKAAEKKFQETTEGAVDNAMDVLDDEGSFDVESE